MTGAAFEVVERTGHITPSRNKYTKYQPIVDTATSGKAVRLALNGLTVVRMQGRLRNALRARGYHLRYRYRGGDHIICWAEKRDRDE